MRISALSSDVCSSDLLLVGIDPYPTVTAVLHDRSDGVYLLPAATQFETVGSATASNRSLQWREKVVEPLFECKTDHEIMYLFASKLGFAEAMFKHIAVNGTEPLVEDIPREFHHGTWRTEGRRVGMKCVRQ